MTNDLKAVFSGKIAVATNNQKNVTGHIGKCKFFEVYEIACGKIISRELRENDFTNHRMKHHQHHHGEIGGHNHAHLIEGLKDCKYLISNGGGWRVVEDLKRYNINTIFTNENLIEDTLSKFLAGELENDNELTCSDDKD